MSEQVFTPNVAAGASLNVTTGVASVNNPIPAGATNIRFTNVGTVPVAVRWGVGAQTAVFTTDILIAVNESAIFGKGNADNVAVISSSAGAIGIICGEGTN